MTNNSQMLVHFIRALRHSIVDSALASLVDDNLAPLSRDQVKPLKSLTKCEALRPPKQIQATREVANRVTVHGGWDRLPTFLILLSLSRSLANFRECERSKIEHPQVVHVAPAEVLARAPMHIHAVAELLIEARCMRYSAFRKLMISCCLLLLRGRWLSLR